MTEQLSPGTERLLQRLVDLGERIFVLTLFASFAVRMARSFALEPYNILAVISEGLVALFIVVRRDADVFTYRPLDWIVALGGTSLAMFVRAGGRPLAPSMIGTVLMFAGVTLAIASKLSLRRSLGLVAANRGVVGIGTYRFIRHPMYAGYVLVYVGFLLNNPLTWNLAFYAATMSLLVVRIFAEERVLANDPAYRTYAGRVRYRLVPGIF